jgi:plastocyanin
VTRRPFLAAVALTLAAGCGNTPSPATQPSPGVATATTAATATATPTPGPAEPAPNARFEVKRGKVVAGPRTVEVRVGDRVVIEAVTDDADELHVHGYDKEVALAPDKPGRLTFTADVAGVFEVELHSGVRLCNLRVR